MKKVRTPNHRFILILSLLFMVIYNLPLWHKIYEIEKATPHPNLLFILSLPLFLFASLTLIFNLIIWPYLRVVVVPLLLSVAAITTYAMWNFGTLIDPGIIKDAALTQSGEILSYLSPNLIGWFFFLAILPITAFFCLRIESKPSWRGELLQRVKSIAFSCAVLLILYLSLFESYAAFGRNHRYIRYLISPTNFIISTIRHFKHEYRNAIPFKRIGLDAINLNKSKKRHNLVVLLIGETSRAMNYSLDGYQRNTNPLLSKQPVISFMNFRSCGTATDVSVPCMFSELPRAQFNMDTARKREGLLDVLKHAGIALLWKDNDEGCKGVCDRIPHEDVTATNDPKFCSEGMCHDGILLNKLDSFLQGNKDALLVLHLVGSHGPNYYQRYPKQFRVFTPTCDERDIQNCNHQSLVNSYDNTIVYNDYIVSSVIDMIKQLKDKNTALIYLSDHGESLGEGGYYLHGLPYFIAHKEQTTVPFILYLSDSMIKHQDINIACLKKKALHTSLSQDYLFSSVLDLMDIKTSVYNKNLDLFDSCKR